MKKNPLRAKKWWNGKKTRVGSKNALNRNFKPNKGISVRVKSPTKLKKELDKWFSLYIRNKYAKNGTVYCYTCNKPCTVKTIQCGHFVPRQYLATRWDEDNCRPQEAGCNVWGRGQLLDFEENLIAEIGKDKVEALKQKRHQILKLSPQWYLEKIEYYKKKVELLTSSQNS